MSFLFSGGLFDVIPDSVITHLDIWYPMNEGSGIALADFHEAQDASLFNGQTWESNQGWGNTSPVLDGIDDWWRTDATVSASGGVTILTWFRPANLTDRGGLVGFVDDPQSPSEGFEITYIPSENRTGSAVFSGGNSSGAGGVSGINTADVWYLIAAVGDESNNEITQYLYSNTQQIGSNTQSAGFSLPPSLYTYGGFETNNFEYFNGAVDAAGVALGSQLSKSTIDQIWQDTQR